MRLKIPLAGFYNVYNVLAAAAVGDAMGLEAGTIKQSLQASVPAFGRQEVFSVDDKAIKLLLVKNPTGFNQIIQTFLAGEQTAILMAINDNYADGRDVSWLWDTAIEDIHPNSNIIVCGTRAADMALRLKYAGFECATAANLAEGTRLLISELKSGEAGYVLPTYTAMLEIRKLLGKRSGVSL